MPVLLAAVRVRHPTDVHPAPVTSRPTAAGTENRPVAYPVAYLVVQPVAHLVAQQVVFPKPGVPCSRRPGQVGQRPQNADTSFPNTGTRPRPLPSGGHACGTRPGGGLHRRLAEPGAGRALPALHPRLHRKCEPLDPPAACSCWSALVGKPVKRTDTSFPGRGRGLLRSAAAGERRCSGGASGAGVRFRRHTPAPAPGPDTLPRWPYPCGPVPVADGAGDRRAAARTGGPASIGGEFRSPPQVRAPRARNSPRPAALRVRRGLVLGEAAVRFGAGRAWAGGG